MCQDFLHFSRTLLIHSREAIEKQQKILWPKLCLDELEVVLFTTVLPNGDQYGV